MVVSDPVFVSAVVSGPFASGPGFASEVVSAPPVFVPGLTSGPEALGFTSGPVDALPSDALASAAAFCLSAALSC